MNKEKIKNPPVLELFILFATYGGMLLVILTALFWEWSAMASLGTFYLVLIAPVAVGSLAWWYRTRRKESKYHRLTFDLSVGYFAALPLLFLFAYLTK